MHQYMLKHKKTKVLNIMYIKCRIICKSVMIKICKNIFCKVEQYIKTPIYFLRCAQKSYICDMHLDIY